jgi:hypothetical protein
MRCATGVREQDEGAGLMKAASYPDDRTIDLLIRLMKKHA